MSQVVPTEPGWWWAEVTLGPDLPLDPGGVEVVAFRIYEHGGRLYALTPGHRWAGDSGVSGEPVDVTPSILKDSSYSRRWLAPVAGHEEVERLRAEVGTLTLACEELLAQAEQLRAAVSAFVEQAQLRGGAK